MYKYVYVYIYIYVHMYICTYVHMYTCIHVYMYICTYAIVAAGISGTSISSQFMVCRTTNSVLPTRSTLSAKALPREK